MANKSFITIKRSSEFQELKLNGKRYSPTSWLTVNFRPNSFGLLRLGVTSGRKVGNAVLRNRLKRWCKVYVRSLKQSGRDFEIDINIIFRPSKEDFSNQISFSEFSLAMDKTFHFIGKKP